MELDHHFKNFKAYEIIHRTKLNVEQLGQLVIAFKEDNPFWSLIIQFYTDNSRKGDYRLFVIPNVSCSSEEEHTWRLAKELKTLDEIRNFINGFGAAMRTTWTAK